MTTPKPVTFPALSLTISAHLYSPASDGPSRSGAAIVISHPMTGIKEQASANYARALAAAGFWALAFDAAYQGESTGNPRGLEDPSQRVEDNKAAVTYLTTLSNQDVDPNKIGMLGICASGGYTSCAAQSDLRVKALATVSAACVGHMTRNGGLLRENNTENREAINGALQAAAQWRKSNAKAENEAPKMFSTTIDDLSADTLKFFRDAAMYYGDSNRGKHERSDQRVPLMSYDMMVTYDSFRFQHLIAPRPLLMIAGNEADTLHFSESAVEKAGEPKELFAVKGQTHFGLYDDLEVAGPKLVEFFVKALG
jgi:fermentation-respiration switch protein FrsA (DUF1100 family)